MKSPAQFSSQHTIVTPQSLRSQNSQDHSTRYNFVFQGATGPRSRRTPCRGPATRRTAVMASCSPRCGHLRTLAPTRVWPTTDPLSRSTVKRKEQPTNFSRKVFTRYLNAKHQIEMWLHNTECSRVLTTHYQWSRFRYKQLETTNAYLMPTWKWPTVFVDIL